MMPLRAIARGIARASVAVLFVSVTTMSAPAAEPPPLRVLFVGNSLTYVQDMPLMVESIADASGGPRVITRSVSRGGYSLEDHWDRPGVHSRIKRGRWDFVVLQQGPSSLDESRALLRRDVARFAGIIRAAGAEPAVYQVWPELGRIEVFPAVLESYRLAAEDVGAPLLAAGAAWQAAWALDPTLELYGPDGLHPSKQGAYLAAMVIFEGLTGRSAAAAPAQLTLRNGHSITIDEAEVATLLRAAAAVRAPDFAAAR